MKYTTIEKIFSERKNDPNGFSFEYEQKEVSVIRDEADRRYLRVYKKQCAAEGNGRPVTTVRDVCYPIDAAAKVDAANWKTFKKYSQRILLEDRSFEGI